MLQRTLCSLLIALCSAAFAGPAAAAEGSDGTVSGSGSVTVRPAPTRLRMQCATAGIRQDAGRRPGKPQGAARGGRCTPEDPQGRSGVDLFWRPAGRTRAEGGGHRIYSAPLVHARPEHAGSGGRRPRPSAVPPASSAFRGSRQLFCPPRPQARPAKSLPPLFTASATLGPNGRCRRPRAARNGWQPPRPKSNRRSYCRPRQRRTAKALGRGAGVNRRGRNGPLAPPSTCPIKPRPAAAGRGPLPRPAFVFVAALSAPSAKRPWPSLRPGQTGRCRTGGSRRNATRTDRLAHQKQLLQFRPERRPLWRGRRAIAAPEAQRV